MDPLERDGSLHRMFLEGGGELFMTGRELGLVQGFVYYCHPCAAYHLRPGAQEHEFIKAINEPWEPGKEGMTLEQ
jgi:hypothetical protein